MSTNPLRRLAQLATRLEQTCADRDQAIRDAKAAGHTWEQVAAAARMSRAGAIKAARRRPATMPAEHERGA